jgi:hypothetical protein
MTYVPTRDIRPAVAGREGEVLAALGIDLPAGGGHRRCPFGGHDDRNPSWRWDTGRARAHCTCLNGHTASILDVIMKVREVGFAEAKVECAQILGRTDLIRQGPQAESMQALRNALASIGELRGQIEPRRVGRFLATHEGRVERGFRATQAGTRSNAVLWQVDLLGCSDEFHEFSLYPVRKKGKEEKDREPPGGNALERIAVRNAGSRVVATQQTHRSRMRPYRACTPAETRNAKETAALSA